MKFLGHIISPTGITTDPDKIAKVSHWPIPVNKQEVQQFLGLVNYYRWFVKNCSEVFKPLYCLPNEIVRLSERSSARIPLKHYEEHWYLLLF